MEKPQASVFEIAIRKRGAKPQAAPASKSPKRANIFSQSRDTREDRAARQVKTAHNPQTFSRSRGF